MTTAKNLIPQTSHPPFIQSYKPSPVWKNLVNHHNAWLDITVRKVLSGESKCVKEVYKYLRYVDVEDQGFAYPAQTTIARAKKISRGHVIRCLARLEELELIYRWKKARHSFYIFTLPQGLEKPKTDLEKAKKECAQIVENLGEKTIKFHIKQGNVTKNVTSKCNTNNNGNIKRIEIHPSKLPVPPVQKENLTLEMFRERVELGEFTRGEVEEVLGIRV